MKISELCLSERPREKLLSKGAEALSDAELLAILIRTGTKSRSALELAHGLLFSAEGSLVKLSHMDLKALCKVPGIKNAKAPAIAAALELGRRFMNETAYETRSAVKTPGKIFRMMIPHLKGLQWEECWILLLNSSQYPVAKLKVTGGGTDMTLVDKREIIRQALAHKAKYIVLIHNHPSGNPLPSQADIDLTEDICQAAVSMDLRLLDHLVVCDDCFYSFSDEMMTRAL